MVFVLTYSPFFELQLAITYGLVNTVVCVVFSSKLMTRSNPH